MDNKLENIYRENFERLLTMKGKAFYTYLIWKTFKKAISIPEVGFEDATKNTFALNMYNGIFSGIVNATEQTYINDLYKLFDKNSKALRIESMFANLNKDTKKKIIDLQNSIKSEFEIIKTLRHEHTAHESLEPTKEKLHIEEIEKIFSVVSQILNLIAKDFRYENVYTWERQDTEDGVKKLIDVLRQHEEYISP